MPLVPGLVSVTFRQLDAAKVVELVVRAGLSAVEWGADVHVPVGDMARAKDVRHLCETSEIQIASYGSYYRAGVDDPEDFGDVVATARALGAPSVRIWAGRSGSDHASFGDRRSVVRAIQRAADESAEAGMLTCLEYHHGTLTDTVAATLNLLETIERGNVRTYWQPPLGTPPNQYLSDVEVLRAHLAALHVFAWADDGTRLPLAAGGQSWAQPVALLHDDPLVRYALIEFVVDDDPRVLASDARTMRSWLGLEEPTTSGRASKTECLD